MKTALPTSKYLEKLSVRAIVAYAARTARRLSSEVRRVVPDDLVEGALRQVESVSTSSFISEIDTASIISAADNVAGSYSSAPASMRSAKKGNLMWSLVQAAMVAMYAVLAAKESSNARDHRKKAAQAAERVVHRIEALSTKAAVAARQAARQDYDTLLREYGEHDDVVIGEPIRCFSKN